ncbi:hypothetical protein NXS98_09150 [Fontisphaera persica]|uniref:hypothetical protein n=1 Tax=Fontisphaera persica TaxID=2974023 RepID=UPI0024C0D61C|nr:hypothetical protein [Fontisphaera persica]WCJ57897.1 hypothetical protein NXS98_09150 [Fontisphaera persica]
MRRRAWSRAARTRVEGRGGAPHVRRGRGGVRRAGILLAAIVLAWFMGGVLEAARPTFDGEAVYHRATNTAGAVLLFKPVSQDTQKLETVLAPFILQSTGAGAGEVARQRAAFGVPLPGAAGSSAVVYFRAGTTPWGGVVHTQMMYLWLYAGGEADEALPAQGVRITLNRQGFPVIWEMLAAPQGRQEVYVAGSVEHASLRHFGGRLPGRRFAVEPAVAEAPALVMPLVVEDGPVVFGPMVYLEGRTRGPHAVICRCMPALATAIVDTVYYRLEQWPADAARQLRRRRDGARVMRMLEVWERQPVAQRLRLAPP